VDSCITSLTGFAAEASRVNARFALRLERAETWMISHLNKMEGQLKDLAAQKSKDDADVKLASQSLESVVVQFRDVLGEFRHKFDESEKSKSDIQHQVGACAILASRHKGTG